MSKTATSKHCRAAAKPAVCYVYPPSLPEKDCAGEGYGGGDKGGIEGTEKEWEEMGGKEGRYEKRREERKGN